MTKYEVEVTDTFGGESNYSWIRSETIEVKEHAKSREIVRQAKHAMGWTGVRCERHDYGDMFELRPRGVCQVMFIRYKDGD